MSNPTLSRDETRRMEQRAIIRERCREKGEERVAAEVAGGVAFNPFQIAVMREWLDERRVEAVAAQRAEVERSEREARIEASNAESLRTAKSAKNAAWAAAIAAIIAIVVSIAIPVVSKFL